MTHLDQRADTICAEWRVSPGEFRKIFKIGEKNYNKFNYLYSFKVSLKLGMPFVIVLI